MVTRAACWNRWIMTQQIPIRIEIGILKSSSTAPISSPSGSRKLWSSPSIHSSCWKSARGSRRRWFWLSPCWRWRRGYSPKTIWASTRLRLIARFGFSSAAKSTITSTRQSVSAECNPALVCEGDRATAARGCQGGEEFSHHWSVPLLSPITAGYQVYRQPCGECKGSIQWCRVEVSCAVPRQLAPTRHIHRSDLHEIRLVKINGARVGNREHFGQRLTTKIPFSVRNGICLRHYSSVLTRRPSLHALRTKPESEFDNRIIYFAFELLALCWLVDCLFVFHYKLWGFRIGGDTAELWERLRGIWESSLQPHCTLRSTCHASVAHWIGEALSIWSYLCMKAHTSAVIRRFDQKYYMQKWWWDQNHWFDFCLNFHQKHVFMHIQKSHYALHRHFQGNRTPCYMAT